jgi:hypothetical protein
LDAQHAGRLAIASFFEVPQREHFPVQRIHIVESYLEA